MFTKFFKHGMGQPFIFATGIGALIHSTWSLGTFFTGEMMPLEEVNSFFAVVRFLNWLVPAFLIAFALDVGQISTSHEIRSNGLTVGRAVTFAVFALATYYLQWLYLVHHTPVLLMSDAVSAYPDFAQWFRSMYIWILPLLLPLSTVMYTISSSSSAPAPVAPAPVVPVQDGAEVFIIDSLPVQDDDLLLPVSDELVHLTCEDCGWSTGDKEDFATAQKSLRTHKSRYCEPEFSSNGVHLEG